MPRVICAIFWIFGANESHNVLLLDSVSTSKAAVLVLRKFISVITELPSVLVQDFMHFAA